MVAILSNISQTVKKNYLMPYSADFTMGENSSCKDSIFMVKCASNKDKKGGNNERKKKLF